MMTATPVQPGVDDYGPSPIEVDRARLARGQRVVLEVELLRLRAGVTAIVGANGSGKSTLLHAFGGLLTPTSGTVRVLDRRPVDVRSRVAYVLQAQDVPSQLLVTAREVVALGRAARLGPFRRFRPPDDDAVQMALQRLELEELAGRHIAELSGGQRQRVFIAQGLAQQAEVLLLDEPLAGLDLASAERIRVVMEEERTAGRVVLLATHDLDDAARADHVVLLAGRVVADGAPAAVLTAAHLRAAYGARVLELDDRVIAVEDDAHGHLGP